MPLNEPDAIWNLVAVTWLRNVIFGDFFWGGGIFDAMSCYNKVLYQNFEKKYTTINKLPEDASIEQL